MGQRRLGANRRGADKAECGKKMDGKKMWFGDAVCIVFCAFSGG
jgi:hypothetical protein